MTPEISHILIAIWATSLCFIGLAVAVSFVKRGRAHCMIQPEPPQEPMTPQQAEAQRLRNMRLELDWLPRSKADDPKNWTPKREARLQELIRRKERGEI